MNAAASATKDTGREHLRVCRRGEPRLAGGGLIVIASARVIQGDRRDLCEGRRRLARVAESPIVLDDRERLGEGCSPVGAHDQHGARDQRHRDDGRPDCHPRPHILNSMPGATTVIDCDSHLMEPADLWERYLEPRYRDRAIKIVEVDGAQQLVADGQVVLPFGLAGLGGVNIWPRSRLFSENLRYEDGCPPASNDPKARAELLDEWGVDRAVLFPTIGILPLPTSDVDLLTAYCRAYNTWQAEFSQSISGRTIPVATLNLCDRDGAIAELERCLDLGFRGVFLAPEPVDGRRPGDAWFDAIWERCAEAGVPVFLHVVVRFGGAGVPFLSWHETVAVGSLFSFGLTAPGQIIPALTTMVADRVFDRVPALKVVCVEAGCGWAGYLADRLDEKHEFFGSMMETPLELMPSDYLRRNVWFVAEPDERTIGATLDALGEDRVLWGSDFPHIDSTLDAADRIRKTIEPLSEQRRAGVLGANAEALFGGRLRGGRSVD